MKFILISFLAIIVSGCATTKIKVFDYSTQEPIYNALVMISESHYPFSKHTIKTYKTNILGEVVINYKPSDIVVAKEGYWHARETIKNVIYLVRGEDSPNLIPNYGGLSVIIINELSSGDICYDEWKNYLKYERNIQHDYICKHVKKDLKLSDKDIEPTFMKIQSQQRYDFIKSSKR
jgi:lipoprotein